MLLSPTIERAIEFAAEWHDGTYRKGRWRKAAVKAPPGEAPPRVPVMAHLTAVATTVQRAGWDDETIAAAFLHDALEDENRHGERLDRAVLRETFGETVAAMVADVSEQKKDETGAWRSWRERKEEYVRQLRSGRPGAVAISLADKLHNLWTMNESLARGIDIFTTTETRRGLSAGPEAQQWFFRAVLEVAAGHDDDRLAPMRQRLEEELRRFEELAALGSAQAG